MPLVHKRDQASFLPGISQQGSLAVTTDSYRRSSLLPPSKSPITNSHTISNITSLPPTIPACTHIYLTAVDTRGLAFTMPTTTAETLSLVSRNVTVAPLVLLSVVDHFNRAAKGTRKRVVGVLLGQNDGKNVRVSNSFAGQPKHPAPAAIFACLTLTQSWACSTFRGR